MFYLLFFWSRMLGPQPTVNLASPTTSNQANPFQCFAENVHTTSSTTLFPTLGGRRLRRLAAKALSVHLASVSKARLVFFGRGVRFFRGTNRDGGNQHDDGRHDFVVGGG